MSAVQSHTRLSPVAAGSPSFGAMLKRYRRAAGLTQEELAERSGYSVGHISKLESSARQPVPATVELLGDALDLSPAERSALARAAHRDSSHLAGPPHLHTLTLPPLLGRAQEEQRIERHLAEDDRPLLLFSGEPGIGKSRLMVAAADQGVRDGWFVLEGTCRRNGAQGPYGPLIDALAKTVGRMDHAQLRAALKGCTWLVRLVPELAETGAVQMPAWALPADQERRLMFAAVYRFLCNIAGPAGTLLVLDNLQWAGADALALLCALAEAAPRSSLRIVGAYRDNEVRPGDQLSVLQADLAREGLIARESIGPLVPPTAAQLLNVLLAGAEDVDDKARAEVLLKSAGVPFILVSYAQWLRSPVNNARTGTAALAIPWDVGQTVRERVAALSEAAQAVVKIAAVSDEDDSRHVLVTVARQLGYGEIDAVEAIDAACMAGLLAQRSDKTYGFTYDLTREVVEHSIGGAQRAYLHGRIADALVEEGYRESVETIFIHYVQADAPEQALAYLKLAGARAKALHAFSDAERYYRALTERLNAGGYAEEAAIAREQLGIMLCFMGRYDEAHKELERALEAYRTQGWRDGQARVAAEIGSVYYAQGDFAAGIARLERELTDAPDLADRSKASLYVALAQLYKAGADYGRELEYAEQAAYAARGGGDRHLLALAEMERGTALNMADRLDEGLQVLEDMAVPLTDATGDLWGQAMALDRASQARILRGEFAEASADIERGILVGWQLDDPLVSAMMTLNRGILRFYTGAWRQAQADLRAASGALQALRLRPAPAARALVWRGRLSLAKGRYERAGFELARGVVASEQSGDAQSVVVAHCALAEQELLDRKPDAARMRLEPLLAGGEYRLSDLTEVLALLGWAYLELDDERQSAVLVAASAIRASTTELRCALTDALRIHAMLLARKRLWEEADVTLAKSISLGRELSYPYAEAKALYVLGNLLIQRGEVARGQEQLAAARSISHRMGERLYASDGR